MKQYTVQMKINNKWVSAHAPNNLIKTLKNDKQAILKNYNAIKESWHDYSNKYNGKLINPPTDFRIVSRNVTEWTEEK